MLTKAYVHQNQEPRGKRREIGPEGIQFPAERWVRLSPIKTPHDQLFPTEAPIDLPIPTPKAHTAHAFEINALSPDDSVVRYRTRQHYAIGYGQFVLVVDAGCDRTLDESRFTTYRAA